MRALAAADYVCTSSAAPFNPANQLISPAAIHELLSAHLPRFQAQQLTAAGCGQFYKAMVHRSYCTRKNENFVSGNAHCPAGCLPLQEESNERLELLGDAVLGLIVAEYLYERFPEENEGFLTRLRSKIVNGTMLSELSARLGLDRHVIVSRQIEDAGGRRNKKVLEDAFEAFIGAMYLTLQDYEATRDWFVAFLEDSVDVSQLVLTQNNHKDMLVKYFQHNFNAAPQFLDAPSPGSNRVAVMVRGVNGSVIGAGSGSTRRHAEEDAAKAALRYFGAPVYA